jgi:hypothetical protein
MRKKSQIEKECLCGRIERVARENELVMCAICLMEATDVVDKKLLREQSGIDWGETFKSICTAEVKTQRWLAHRLELSQPYMTLIKGGIRGMPEKAKKYIEKHYGFHIKDAKNES